MSGYPPRRPSRVISRAADPGWAINQTHTLCTKGEEERFREKGNLLDGDRFTSIRQTVASLNAGEVDGVGDGFCIVFSQNAGVYFLMYKRGCQKKAFVKFGVHGEWSSKRSALLCKKGQEQEFEGKAFVLDEKLNCKTVEQAIDLLNYPHDHENGMVEVPRFCIVSVEEKGEYHIIWVESRKDEVYNLFGVPAPAAETAPVLSDKVRSISHFENVQQRFASKVNGLFKSWGFQSECTQTEETSHRFDPKQLVNSYSRALSSKYDIIRQIGSGAQGTAHLVRKKNCAEDDMEALYVAKETHDMSTKGVADFKTEFEKMRELRHPNCLRVIELLIYEPLQQMYLISDYARGGDLYHYMQEMIQQEGAEHLSEAVIAKMMQKAMMGVAHLHSAGFVHNDLKPDNLLVMEPYKKGAAPRVVVADYGCATMEHQTEKVFFGDPRYMSPESMKAMMAYLETQKRISSSGPSVDVWAMGVTFYEFLGKGVIPFLYDTCNLKNLKGVFPQLKAALLSPKAVEFRKDDSGEDEFSEPAQDLLRHMLQKDFTNRWSAQQVLGHEWFKVASTRKTGFSNMNHIRFHASRDTVRQVLRNAVAAKLRHEHVEKSFKLFHQFDPDNSGSISQDEFRAAWEQYDPKTAKNADEYFKRADVDGNKSLEFNEFAAITLDWGSLQSEVLDQHLLDMFDCLKEGATELDIDSFKRLFKGLGVTEEDVENCAKEVDADGDGTITLEELKWFVQKGGEAGAGFVTHKQAQRMTTKWSGDGRSLGSTIGFDMSYQPSLFSHQDSIPSDEERDEISPFE